MSEKKTRISTACFTQPGSRETRDLVEANSFGTESSRHQMQRLEGRFDSAATGLVKAKKYEPRV